MSKICKISCDSCGTSFGITCGKKQEISYCPFCGDDLCVVDRDRPLFNSFDEMDEFDEVEYYHEEDE